MGMMVLKAATDKCNSECEVDLGIDNEEWESMSEQEQKDLVDEMLGNVCEYWVEECD